MKNSLTAISISLFLVACGGSGSEDVGTTEPALLQGPNLGAAVDSPTNTDSLNIDRSFSFDTARTIDIDFNIEAAISSDANVSICTDYSPAGLEYDVNFESCMISGTLEDGVFKHSMEVTNDKDAVVAVVLFQDATIAPLYKEFKVDAHQRSKGNGSMRGVIVWN